MIIAAKIPVSYQEVANPWLKRQEKDNQSHRYNAIKLGNIHDVNLIFYNLPEFNELDAKQLQALTCGKYTIAYWLWEQPSVPQSLRDAFYHVDEIWTSSQFCKNAFSAVRPIPVHVIPHPLHITAKQPLSHAQLGVTEGSYTFFYSFAATSSDQRKNPLGVIEAFRRAFPADYPQPPALIIKAHHLDKFPEYAQVLKEQVASVNGILIEESLTRQAMNDLLASIDCYISLHRAEGFGIGMAEAMALGKPVIATRYSGNIDFMNDDNSFLVDYDLAPVFATDFKFQPDYAGLYESGQVWAEPHLDHAAELMRYVVDNPELAAKRGQIAKNTIETHFSPQAVASRIQKRLCEIDPNHRHSVWKLIPVTTAPDVLDLQKTYTELQVAEDHFQQWDHERIPETRNAIYNIPLVGYVLRMLVRVKNLGKMWANLKFTLQSFLLFQKMILKNVESLQDSQYVINKLTIDMTLHQQQAAQDIKQIHQLRAELDNLKQQLEQLQNDQQ